MVQLVDILVQRSPVQSPVRKVVKHVFKHKEECDLRGHEGDGRKGDLVSRHAEITADRVEQVDEWEFAGEMGEEDDFGAFPDLGVCYAFLLYVNCYTDGGR